MLSRTDNSKFDFIRYFSASYIFYQEINSLKILFSIIFRHQLNVSTKVNNCQLFVLKLFLFRDFSHILIFSFKYLALESNILFSSLFFIPIQKLPAYNAK